MSVVSRGNPLPKPEETKNTYKNEDGEVRSDLLHHLPDWPQEFREKLVDENVLVEPRGDASLGHRDTSSSNHDIPVESRAKVERVSGKHSVYTHADENNKGFLQKTCWYRVMADTGPANGGHIRVRPVRLRPRPT